MGLDLFKDDYPDFKDQATNRRSDNINPDPRNFIINKLERVNEFTILEVTYPNCVNFEGRKILVLKGMTKEQIKNLKTLDPHFGTGSNTLPIVARFRPTTEGWKYALAFCTHV